MPRLVLISPPASAGEEWGSLNCGSVRYVSIRSDTIGTTTHTYLGSSGFVRSWYFPTRTVKFSASPFHSAYWNAEGSTLYTAGTYGLCLT